MYQVQLSELIKSIIHADLWAFLSRSGRVAVRYMIIKLANFSAISDTKKNAWLSLLLMHANSFYNRAINHNIGITDEPKSRVKPG